jgi:hypothetical protein
MTTLRTRASSLSIVCGTFFFDLHLLDGELSGLPYGGVLGRLEPAPHAALIGTVCPISNYSGPHISSRERACCTGTNTPDANVILRALGTVDCSVQCNARMDAWWCRNTPLVLLQLLGIEGPLANDGRLLLVL